MGILLSSLFKIELSMNLNNTVRITNEGVKFILFFYSALKVLPLTQKVLTHCNTACHLFFMFDCCGEQ